MLKRIKEIKKFKKSLIKIGPLISFGITCLWLYLLDPLSFEIMWKGRTFQLFFIWLITIELILNWESIQIKKMTFFSIKSLGYITLLTLPIVYVVVSNYLGLNEIIVNLSQQMDIHWWDSMALSMEYLVFTLLFCLILFFSFGKDGLKEFSVPLFFLAVVGTLYTIDNIFPYGEFTPFQLMVPTTAMLAAIILGFLGYDTALITIGNMSRLTATDPSIAMRSATFDIAWPCAGIESLLIYTVIILLFLKRTQISQKGKITYFLIGALITYFINVLRIVTIFLIGINQGNFQVFHFYYGPLYSILWIIIYPLIILATQKFRKKLKTDTVI